MNTQQQKNIFFFFVSLLFSFFITSCTKQDTLLAPDNEQIDPSVSRSTTSSVSIKERGSISSGGFTIGQISAWFKPPFNKRMITIGAIMPGSVIEIGGSIIYTAQSTSRISCQVTVNRNNVFIGGVEEKRYYHPTPYGEVHTTLPAMNLPADLFSQTGEYVISLQFSDANGPPTPTFASKSFNMFVYNFFNASMSSGYIIVSMAPATGAFSYRLNTRKNYYQRIRVNMGMYEDEIDQFQYSEHWSTTYTPPLNQIAVPLEQPVPTDIMSGWNSSTYMYMIQYQYELELLDANGNVVEKKSLGTIHEYQI
jgi:hypothetical protein